MTSNLNVTVAVNIDSGTINFIPVAAPTRDHVQALARVARRTAPPRELAA